MKTELTTAEQTTAIAKLLSVAATEAEMERLLDDLLTLSEIEKVYERVLVVAALKKHLSQRESIEVSGSAIATISRGARLFEKPNFFLGTVIDRAEKEAWWRALFWRS